jgi:hypothetical protein
MRLAIVVFNAPLDGALPHVLGSVTSYTFDPPSSRSNRAIKILESIGNARCHTIVDPDGDRVSVKDDLASVWFI